MNEQTDNVINVTTENEVKMYNVWVGDKRVTSGNKDDVLGDGTVKYDPATFTMTLKRAAIHKAYTDVGGCKYGIYTYDDMNLVLNGSSSIDIMGYTAKHYSYGLRVIGVLTVSGSGSLHVTGGAAMDGGSYGIASNAKIIITEGEITAEGARCGVNAWEAVSISGGTLTATGGKEADSCGICSTGEINVSGGIVTASANDATNSSRGMDTSGDIIISGGSIYVVSGSVTDDGVITSAATGNSYGMHTGGGDITITGGTATITGGSGSGKSLGMDAYGSINIKDGTVKVTSSEAEKVSYGMNAATGVIVIDGGVVEAQTLSVSGAKKQAMEQAPRLGPDVVKIRGDWKELSVAYRKDSGHREP